MFYLQEWHQNILNYREKELKTCQERPYLVSGHFIEVFCETTTFEWSQEWSSHTGVTIFLVNSTHNIFTLSQNAFETINSCFATCFFRIIVLHK